MVRGCAYPLAIGLCVMAALAACARTAPPAPVTAGQSGQTRMAAPQFAVAAPPVQPAPPSPHLVRPPPPRPPAPMAAEPHPLTPHPSEITVEAGETLYAVARRYEVPVRALADANHLTPPYALTAGRRLVVPPVRVHTVQAGETLYSVSRLYGIDAITLGQSNGLAPPYKVWTGEPLIVPAPPVETAAISPPAVAREPLAPAPPANGASLPPRPEPSVEHAVQSTSPPAPAQYAALPMPPPPPRGAARGFLWPVHGRVLAGYGTAESGLHNDGLNIAAPAGTIVVASDDGVVAYAGNELRGYGNLVLIKHAQGWLTAYAHNGALLVKRGQHVRRGQPVARVGSSGAVHEPQLHFEIRRGAKPLDPADYLAPSETAEVNG